MDDMGSESELLRASLAGNKEAFGVVVQRYQSLICAIAYSATGDVGKSEELAQETFLRGWKSLRQLENLDNFRGWLCTIARNLASQALRAKPRDIVRAAAPLEQAELLAAPTPDPGQAAIDKEHQEIVWAAMQRVPLKYREPLVLFYREQQSISRVAADLELSEDIVRQRLHRGRQLIKAEVASLVEDTLARSGPGKAFAIGVVAALPALTAPTASGAVIGVVAKGTPAAKTAFAGGISGAIWGPIFGLLGGLLGGLVGAWADIRRTRSPRERRFMIRTSILLWLVVTALIVVPLILALAGMIPWWASSACLLVFLSLFLPLTSLVYALRQQIQIEDGTYSPPPCPPRRTSAIGFCIYSALIIFVATSWVLPMAAIAHDWAVFAIILACAILTILVTVCLVYRYGRRTVAAWFDLAAVAALIVTVVNLRWDVWAPAYRQRAYHDPLYDIPLKGLNVVMIAVVVGVGLELWVRSRQPKAMRKDQTPGSKRLVIFVCLAVVLLETFLTLLAAQRTGLPSHIVRATAVSAVLGSFAVFLGGLGGRRFDAWLRRVDRRTIVAGFVALVVSGLAYSVVHEFGHFIFAVALGGTVKSVTWTIFGNTEPHVAYSHLPARAAPWAWAGGYLFPTTLALVLIAAWYFRRRGLSSLGAAILLIPAAIILLCNLGCIPELFEQNSHVGRFTSYYGMGKMGEVLVSLLFAGASSAVLTAVLLTWKNAKRIATE